MARYGNEYFDRNRFGENRGYDRGYGMQSDNRYGNRSAGGDREWRTMEGRGRYDRDFGGQRNRFGRDRDPARERLRRDLADPYSGNFRVRSGGMSDLGGSRPNFFTGYGAGGNRTWPSFWPQSPNY